MDKLRKVVSLFDGMSNGQIVLMELGYGVGTYYASEVDKHAVKNSSHNFPDMVHLGDVTKWREWDIDWSQVDLVLAGSPCQGFSFAGKQLAFDDPRSALFFVFVEILGEARKSNPDVKFLLENVKMKKEHELVITRYLNVAPIEINSARVSAQNRVRLYWTNIANEPYGFFGDMMCAIPQPDDRGIVLKDILEAEVDEKYYVKNPKFGFNGMDIHKKGNNLRIGGSRSQSDKHNYDLIKVDVNGNVKGNQDKASCFTAGGNSGGNSGGNHSDMDLLIVGRVVGRNPDNPKSREAGLYTEQMFEPRLDEKSGTLTTVGKDNMVLRVGEATQKGFVEVSSGDCFDMTIPDSKTRRVRLMVDKSNCMTASKFEFMHYDKNYRIRRLTPKECARLQTIPDWYEWVVSDSQIYRMLGNGWTVEVIKHILSFMERPQNNVK